MKLADITRLEKEGFITSEQAERIKDRFQLHETGSHFIKILSIIGAILLGAGVILIISANWNEIPRLVKIACALGLMLGAHGAAHWLKARPQPFERAAEAMHLAGSLLWLANLALIGQVYHLSSRPQNIVLYWLIGVAPIAWILRSRLQQAFLLVAAYIWAGMEMARQGWLADLGFGWNLLIFSSFGLFMYGAGAMFRRVREHRLAEITEVFGLIGMQACAFPFCFQFSERFNEAYSLGLGVFSGLAMLGLGLTGISMARDERLPRQWRAVWIAALGGLMAMLLLRVLAAPGYESYRDGGQSWQRWLFVLAAAVFFFVEMRIGVQLQSSALVNLGVAFIGAEIVSVYISLISSMGWTGGMFILSGLFLMGLGIYLEKKRRSLLRKVQGAASLHF